MFLIGYVTIYTSTSLPLIYVGLIIYGSGIGINVNMFIILKYLPVIRTSWRYFPNYKGRVTGILVSCFGISATVFNLFATFYINPEGKKATIEVEQGRFYDETITENVIFIKK